MFEQDAQFRIFGVTPVENLFLVEYMPAANGDYVKVYLSGLFHSMQGDTQFGITDMAAELNLKEADVEAALRYWERRRLVARISDKPPVYRFFHLGQHMLTGQDAFNGDTAYITFYEAVNALFGSRRKLKNQEITLAYEWVQDLGLRQEVVLMMLNYLIDTRGVSFSFKAAQSLAVTMREAGIQSTEDAEGYLNHSKRIHDGARAVLRRFSLRRQPSEDELNLYRVWTETWGFTDEAILAACAETVKAQNPSFGYLNGILSSLRKRTTAASGKQVAQHLETQSQRQRNAQEVLRTLGARVNASAIQAAYDALAERFPHALILLAAGEVTAQEGMFQDIEPLLESWQAQGIADEAAARKSLAVLHRHDGLLKRLMDAAGQKGQPTLYDREQLVSWLNAGHSEALLLAAAAQARSARVKMPYINKVLERWRAAGITTPEAALASAPAATPGKKVGAQQYTQRQYTEEELMQTFVDITQEVQSQNEQ